VFVFLVFFLIFVVFLFISLGGRPTPATGLRFAAIAAAVTVAAIAARIVWVTGAAAYSRWRCRPRPDGAPGPRDAVALSGRAAAVVGWCGMRGTVTLAAALALPTDFPQRDLILTTAFGVTLGTLVLQGLTLRPLLLALRLEDDGSVTREIRLARAESLRAAVAAIAARTGEEAADLVRHRFAVQLRRAEAELAGHGAAAPQAGAAPTLGGDGAYDDRAVVRAAMAAQRRRLVSLRDDGTIGDAAFQRVEEELDWTELGWAQVVHSGGGVHDAP
jgi:CPA1 family monovalent cation:H+ antiporter